MKLSIPQKDAILLAPLHWAEDARNPKRWNWIDDNGEIEFKRSTVLSLVKKGLLEIDEKGVWAIATLTDKGQEIRQTV